jgi:CubicO group peptidase (beta-lactamase class C family)
VSSLSTAAALERALDDLVEHARTPGLQYVVVNASSTLFERYAGVADITGQRPMRAGITMMAYSMSKTVTAAAVLQLVESNRVRLDDPVARYVSPQPYGSEFTVRQLLSHTSGTPNPIPLRWVHPSSAHETFDERAELARVLRRHGRLAFTPGTRFKYSNIGYWLLGGVVEQASGQPFTSYVTGHVLGPLGVGPDQLAYAIGDPATHAAGYLEKYSLFNLIKPWLIDRALIGDYEGPWLRIRDHYLNGPAFGGLVGTAAGFGAFLRDQLAAHSCLFGDQTRALFVEPQRTARGTIPMTLGWHMGSGDGTTHLFKEGGGGGFHCMMRLYPREQLGTVLMTNATGLDVKAALDRVDAIAREWATSP